MGKGGRLKNERSRGHEVVRGRGAWVAPEDQQADSRTGANEKRCSGGPFAARTGVLTIVRLALRGFTLQESQAVSR